MGEITKEFDEFIADEEIRMIENWMNNRSRKRLEFSSFAVAFH